MADCQLGSVTDAESGKKSCQMDFYGSFGDGESAGNLLVGEAAPNAFEDIALAGREVG